MARKSLPPAVKLNPVLLPLSREPAPTFQLDGFLNVTCVVLVEPSVSRAAVDVPFKLNAVNSLVVPPVNNTEPTAVLVMAANLLEPVIVSAPVPPWLIVG